MDRVLVARDHATSRRDLLFVSLAAGIVGVLAFSIPGLVDWIEYTTVSIPWFLGTNSLPLWLFVFALSCLLTIRGLGILPIIFATYLFLYALLLNGIYYAAPLGSDGSGHLVHGNYAPIPTVALFVAAVLLGPMALPPLLAGFLTGLLLEKLLDELDLPSIRAPGPDNGGE